MIAAELSPAVSVGLMAVILILAGLGIMALSGKVNHIVLTAVFWYLGLLIAVLGAVLLLAPIVAWIAAQLRAMLGL